MGKWGWDEARLQAPWGPGDVGGAVGDPIRVPSGLPLPVGEVPELGRCMGPP